MWFGKIRYYWLDDLEEYVCLGGIIYEWVEVYCVYMSNGLDWNEEKMIGFVVKCCKFIGLIWFVKEVYWEYGVFGINWGLGWLCKYCKKFDG